LGDLPSLGSGPVINNAAKITNNSNSGFDDFGFDDDSEQEKPSSKINDAEKHLQDFYQEENEGFRLQVNNVDKKKANQP
jgi:hypothetical protein